MWKEKRNGNVRYKDRIRDPFTGSEKTISVTRLNKTGLPEISDETLIKTIKGVPNYTEGEDRQIYFVQGLQLLVVRNNRTKDIISVVRRKEPKEVWKSV